MGWSNTVRKAAQAAMPAPAVTITPDPVDWDRLVTLDFETYFDADYTLRKLTTSEYVRDARFKAQMVGIKIGNKPTKVYPAAQVRAALAAIPWNTHSLLAHHAQFDGFILSHHFGIQPKKIYCTMSMARGLFSNDIGAGLHEVSIFCGGVGKTDAESLDETKGVRNWPAALVKRVTPYCAGDVDECLRCFKFMHPMMPRDEMDIIDFTCRMFTEPVLKVDLPRVAAEHARELEVKRQLMLEVAHHAVGEKLDKKQLAELGDNPSDEAIAVRKAKKLIGSQRYAELLKAHGIEPPVKISPAYFKHRDETKKWTYAFAKTDTEFVALQEHPDAMVRALVEARLTVKSNGNVTRAARFMKAGENDAALPVYLKYGAALTLRWGGGNGMNMQNLKRGGELRRSILAPKGHVIVVVDSGQIEARVNAWLWGQDDLVETFRVADAYEHAQRKLPKAERKIATGAYRDAYCKFADSIYGREVTKLDELERFVGKVGVLGLGYQMGAERLRNTLALGLMGPAVHLTLEECQRIVSVYRRKNAKIKQGWERSQQIIDDMAHGRPGSWKCISWDKDVLYLPNGMTIRYPGMRDKRSEARVAKALADIDPEIDMNWPQFVYDSKDNEVKIYGGKLTENIVQALARIIVAQQLLAIVRAGHRIVMTTHDEGAFLAKVKQGQKVYDFALSEFSKAPAWCADIPLNADGGFDVCYSK